MNFPEVPVRFLERMKALLDEEYHAFEAIYAHPPTHGLRVNTLKIKPDQFERIAPFPLTPLPWSPAGYLVADETRPGKHPYHAAGLYYLQDPHAQAVAEILAPQPGEAVLDLAAAPGGKATHLASLMKNQGMLVANEIKTKRIGHLATNLERWGAHNVTILNESPERLAEFFGPFFDRVLVDAPCSGEGMFRKDRAALLGWSEEAILGCAARQNAILNYAARLVRVGGWLCYATCTFAPEEDETVILQFLENHPEYILTPPPDLFQSHVESTTTNMVRLWPHHSPGEGHFIALLQRVDDTTGLRRSAVPRCDPPVLPNSLRNLWDAWCAENFTRSLDIAPTQVGTRLYALPAGLPKLDGMRVVHPGWWLGNMKKDRFEPSHALAVGMLTEDFQRVLSLPADDSEIQRYLRGETLHSKGPNGWTVVAIASSPTTLREELITLSPSPSGQYPLGWGKRVKNALKNHYPRGLLWL